MGWPTVRLGDVVDRLTNGYVGATRNIYQDDGVPYILARQIKSNSLVFDKKTYVSNEFNQKNKKSILKQGDVLLVQSGHIGHSAVVPAEHEGHNCHALIVITPQEMLNGHYLSYYFSCLLLAGGIEEIRSGSTVPHLTCKLVKELRFILPPIPEQKRIVAILDQAFADIEQARAKTEQNLKNARELFESYLQQIFSQRGEGWVEKGLKDVSLEFGRGKSKHRPRNDESLYGGDYPFIQTGDVRNCEHLITNYSKTYNDKGLAQSKLWPKGTICITIAANIAETGILDFEGCFPDSVIGVVVNPAVTTVRYVEYLLQSFKTILKAKGQGSAQDNINMGTFEKMIFPFPTSIEVQNDIVNSLDCIMNSVQQLERIYSDKLNKIDELKKSILQKAFSGELTKTLEVDTNKGAVA